MIVLEDLTLFGRGGSALASVNAILPSDRRVALLGPSENERALLIKTLGGMVLPNRGRVVRHADVSFPVGQLPGFSRDLSVRVNVAHVARLYGANVRQTVELVEDAFGKSKIFDEPYQDFPRDLRKPLSQLTALSLPFDTYLFADERDFPAHRKRVGRNGHTHFTSVFDFLFEERMRTSGMIISANDVAFARKHCEVAIYLDRGHLDELSSFDEAEIRLRRSHRRRSAGIRRSGI